MPVRDLWVFGYGSLLWNPGFDVAQTVIARLHHYHRSFCMRSIHHRGTVEKPGLVLALDQAPGSYCDGLAFRVAPGTEDATIAYLRERELISSAYVEVERELTLETGTPVTATCYVIDPEHDQYCGGLPLEEQAQIISGAIGGRGPNCNYLWNTADHLQKLGLADSDLDWLAARVKVLRQV